MKREIEQRPVKSFSIKNIIGDFTKEKEHYQKIYSDLLKDPRWQKKRLEIMQRDDFTCQLCLDKETTLNIHHKRYNKARNPWEYDNDVLLTVCEDCHNLIKIAEQSKINIINSSVLKIKDSTSCLPSVIFFISKDSGFNITVTDPLIKDIIYSSSFRKEFNDIIDFLLKIKNNE
jgi:hypothetical protein